MLNRTPRHSFSLECPICFEKFDLREKLPVIFLCGHTFCRKCALYFYRNCSYQCPIDMIEHSYFQNQPGVNYLIIDELSTCSELELCLHHNNFLRFFCLNHNQLRCQDCIAQECIYKRHELKAAEEITRIKPCQELLAKIWELVRIRNKALVEIEHKIKLLEGVANEKYKGYQLKIKNYELIMKDVLPSITALKDKCLNCINDQRSVLEAITNKSDSFSKSLDDWKILSEGSFFEMRSWIKVTEEVLRTDQGYGELYKVLKPIQQLIEMSEGINNAINELDVKEIAFFWPYEGSTVYVTGSWCNWKDRIPLKRSESKSWESEPIAMKRGKHEYKFIVDGNWYYDVNQLNEESGFNNTNNVIKIE